MDLNKERFQVLKDLLGNPSNDKNPIDRNNNVTYPCPFCNHRKPKLTINLETEVYNCWVCEVRGAGIKKMFKKIGLVIPTSYERFFKNNIKNQDINIDNLFPYISKKDNKKNNSEIVIPSGYRPLYVNKNNFFYRGGVDYLINRGLNESHFIKYDIHYSPSERRVLFPSYDVDKKINYYLSRAIYDTDFRYKNANISKDTIIFNEHLVNWNEDLYIVEGVFDAIVSNKNSVPLLGSYVSENSYLMHRLLHHKKRVIFALDPDAKNKMFKCMEKLKSFGVDISYIRWGDDKRDIAEMGSAEFDKKSLSGYDFIDEVINRLGV